MQVITGNLWDYMGQADAVCITTNGFVKKDGCNVMGKGCAKEASIRFPGIEQHLGKKLTAGNIPYILLRSKGTALVSFPVKYDYEIFDGSNVVKHMLDKFKVGNRVPGWACKANPIVIGISCDYLIKLADKHGWQKIIIPRPGCGAGELSWEQVEKIISVLDDRFFIISK